MTWLVIAIIAQFVFAFVFILDKFLVSKTVLSPLTYAFSVGFLEIFVLLLIPFGFSMLPVDQMLISFLAGACWIFGLLFLYKVIQLGEVSRIVPIIGGITPLFVLILAYLFLGEVLNFNQLIAFFLLVFGGMIMAWPRQQKTDRSLFFRRLPKAILAAFLFALSFVLTKYIFTFQPFINSFIWIRLGGFLAALCLFFWTRNSQKIIGAAKAIKFSSLKLFVSNKILAASAFILLNYAIYLGSVSLANALQGVQYAFLFILAVFLSWKFPQVLKEQISRQVITRKITAILLIGLGLGILAF